MNSRYLLTLGCLSGMLTISPPLLAQVDNPRLNTSLLQGGSDLSVPRLGERVNRDHHIMVADSGEAPTPSLTSATTDTTATTPISEQSTDVINSQNVADCLEMSDKMGQYTFAWDETRPEEFGKLYTDDIVFEVWTPGKKEIFYGANEIQGNADINHMMVGVARQNGIVVRHNLSQVVFLEVMETTAKTKTAYSFSIFPTADADVPVVVSGTFNDSWVKTAKGWLVKERVIIYDNFPAILKTVE